MSRARHDMQDVVLEEVDGLGPGTGPPAAGGVLPGDAGPSSGGAPPSGRPRGSRPAARRVRRLWPVGIALAVVVGAGAIDARREAAGPAGLVDVAGVLAPIDGPLRELWRDTGLYVSGLDRVDGLFVGAAQRFDGEVVAVGLDPGTGAETWTTRLSPDGRRTGGATCTTPDAAPQGSASDAVAPGSVPARVTVCVVVDAVGPVDDFSSLGLTEPTETRVVVLDPATGRVLRQAPTDPSTSVAALGSDVVVSHLDEDGRLHVRRTDPLGDRVRWTFTSPEPLEATEYGRWAWVTALDGLVVAGGDSGWVLSADGEPLHSWEPSPRGAGWFDVLGSGLLVQPSSDPSSGLASEVVDLRTSTELRIPGRPVPTSVDDGSAGATVLAQTSDDRLAAFELPTGRPLWSVADAGTGGSGLLIVDGRVVRTQHDGLSAVDASTGAPLWSTPLAPDARYTLLTDGRLVLCGVVDPERGSLLAAYGLDDGRLRWEVDLHDVDHLFVVDGTLFGFVQGGLAAFG